MAESALFAGDENATIAINDAAIASPRCENRRFKRTAVTVRDTPSSRGRPAAARRLKLPAKRFAQKRIGPERGPFLLPFSRGGGDVDA
jgi:hypothetical protein